MGTQTFNSVKTGFCFSENLDICLSIVICLAGQKEDVFVFWDHLYSIQVALRIGTNIEGQDREMWSSEDAAPEDNKLKAGSEFYNTLSRYTGTFITF